ncbi:class I SAM-dependent methyltransferase [Brevundimonas sp.]|uniref:class I SAM-dependent methyltransferase n=1 Tax=Brevundimonas sp. TaxID=1871086 RepID=UPI002FDA3747
MRALPLALGLALLASPLAAQAVSDPIAAAVASDQRPTADRGRDAARKPAEVLAFAGVRTGWKVGEYMPGAGYFTRVLARAVGPRGWVLAYQPTEIVRMRPAFLSEIQAAAAEPGMENVHVVSEPTPAFAAPEPLDLVFTVQNLHDLYGPFASDGTGEAWLTAAYRSLKPGGVLLVVDHHALPGTGLSGAGRLHRIDAEAAKTAIMAAGFVLEAESDLLANADDPRTAGVFDPSIRGRTSQFMLRFRKPV